MSLSPPVKPPLTNQKERVAPTDYLLHLFVENGSTSPVPDIQKTFGTTLTINLERHLGQAPSRQMMGWPCWEIQVSRRTDSEQPAWETPAQLQSKLATVLPQAGAICVQEHLHAQRLLPAPALAIFDLDSTLTPLEGIDALAHRHGVGKQVASITQRAMNGELDFAASFEQRLSQLKGLELEDVTDLIEHPPLHHGATELFACLRRLGVRRGIASGGMGPMAANIATQLQADFCVANQLEVRKGRLTGNLTQPIVDAQAKVDVLRQECRKAGVPISLSLAVGDGANDIPMLTKAGLAIAWQAKDRCRAVSTCPLGRPATSSPHRLAQPDGWQWDQQLPMTAILQLFRYSQRQIEQLLLA